MQILIVYLFSTEILFNLAKTFLGMKKLSVSMLYRTQTLPIITDFS